MIEHENENWSKIFEQELCNNSKKLYSNYWWEDYYNQIKKFTDGYLELNKLNKTLEAGSGSGKSSILLGNSYNRVMLDISDEALKYSKLLADKFSQDNIKFIRGNIFDMPFDDGEFDFVWNIGVLEHYSTSEIVKIVKEMKRVTKPDGAIAFGLPAFYSLPTLKAFFLKYIKFVPGYRLDTEKFYSSKEIDNIISLALVDTNYSKEIKLFGNPLFMETPTIILKTLGSFIQKLIPKWGFLKTYYIKFNDYEY